MTTYQYYSVTFLLLLIIIQNLSTLVLMIVCCDRKFKYIELTDMLYFYMGKTKVQGQLGLDILFKQRKYFQTKQINFGAIVLVREMYIESIFFHVAGPSLGEKKGYTLVYPMRTNIPSRYIHYCVSAKGYSTTNQQVGKL